MKEVEIIEAHAMPEHIYMLIKIPTKTSLSKFVGYLKNCTDDLRPTRI